VKPVIIIVDDEKNTREGLKDAFAGGKYKILLADSGKKALELFKKERIDIMLADLKMPGMDGIALMQKVKQINPSTIFIILTAYGTIETAVNAIHQGAYDFITKPVNLDELDILIKRSLSARKMEMENVLLKKQINKRYGFENIIGNSQEMEHIFEIVNQVAPTKAGVLITGESGTGKELVAHAIHINSPRAKAPFIDVHCASLAETLLESELFGHEKGAFTGAVQARTGRFELADHGTLFLDEISEMNIATQVKLLRVLETRRFQRVGGTKNISVDIRMIAATNADLQNEIKQGRFRADLYYRLNVVNIKIPPLRDRKEDIPLLINSFLRKFNKEYKKHISSIGPEALKNLIEFRWPGNVRELKNLIESIVILSKKDEITVSDLPFYIRENIASGSKIEDAEKTLIKETLLNASNNKTRAAQQLGISRRTLHRKLNEYGIR